MRRPEPCSDPTTLLTSHATGDGKPTSQLIFLVYDRLNRLAAHYMKSERRDHRGDGKVNHTWLARQLYCLQLPNTR